MEEPMEASIIHAKMYAKYLSHCSSEYIIRLALKETGMSSGIDGYQYSLHSVIMISENPFDKLKNGIYIAVGLLRKPPAGQDAVEQAIRAAIRDAWNRRSISLWNYYFPEGCVGHDECPSNRDYLIGIVDFIKLWKGCCEEVRREKEFAEHI